MLDTRNLADGVHELRLVAVAAGPMESRSQHTWPIRVSHHGLEVSLRAERAALSYGEAFSLSGEAAGASSVRLYQGRRLLATAPVREGFWQASVASSTLGEGEVRLWAEARHAGGHLARSPALQLRVLPPATASSTLPMPPGTGQRPRPAWR